MGDFFHTFFGLLIDAAAYCAKYGLDKIKRYARFVWRVTKISLCVVAAYGLVALICLLFRAPWPPLYSGFFVVCGVAGMVIAILLYPIWLSWEILRKFFPQAELSLIRLLRFVGDIAFWASMLAIYCYIVPVWNNPGAMPLFLLVVVALALATLTGRFVPNARFVRAVRTVQLLGLLFLVTISFTFPQTTRRLLAGKRHLDDYGVEMVSRTQSMKVPRFEDLVFFNPKSGRAQVWMEKFADGNFAFYSGEGFSSITRKPYQLVESKKQIQEIRGWFSKREREQAEEQRRKQEAEALARAEAQRKQKEEERARLQRAADDARRQEEQRREQLVKQMEEERRQQEQQRQQLAKEREEYLARYIRQPSEKSDVRIALLVVTENQAPNETAAKALEKIFGERSFPASASFFTPAFLTDGMFEKSFGGSKGVLDKLELTNALDAIVLGRERVQYVTNDALGGLITANLTLELSALSASTHQPISQFSVSAAGPGFKMEQARAVAEERALKKFETEPLDRFTSLLPKKP